MGWGGSKVPWRGRPTSTPDPGEFAKEPDRSGVVPLACRGFSTGPSLAYLSRLKHACECTRLIQLEPVDDHDWSIRRVRLARETRQTW